MALSAARLLRKIHYWVSLPLMVTIFVISISGALLALKKDVDWLQPPTQKGSRPGDFTQPIGTIVDAVASIPGQRTTAWTDIERIDIRPADGMAKVVLKDRTEVQVDIATGQVLQVGYRTSDLIETIHDFSIVSPSAKYLLSFGSALLLIAMAASGVYLFILPMLVRRRKRLR